MSYGWLLLPMCISPYLTLTLSVLLVFYFNSGCLKPFCLFILSSLYCIFILLFFLYYIILNCNWIFSLLLRLLFAVILDVFPVTSRHLQKKLWAAMYLLLQSLGNVGCMCKKCKWTPILHFMTAMKPVFVHSICLPSAPPYRLH